MYLTCIIPNCIYLPESEATPDLRLCSVPVGVPGSAGVDNIRNTFASENSEEVMGLASVSSLLETFEEGVAKANDKTYEQFDEALLTPHSTDFAMYCWLKQAVAYSRVGLTDADEDNPALEVFVVTAKRLNDWD